MPSLQENTLINNLSNDFSEFNQSPLIAGNKIATSFNSYISTVQNVGGGGFISLSGFSTLRKDLQDVFTEQYPSGTIVGSLVATAFLNCLTTLLTLYQQGPPSVTYSAFSTQLQTIFSDYPQSPRIFAQNFGREIHTLCSTAIISGTIPGTPPVPFTGAPA